VVHCCFFTAILLPLPCVSGLAKANKDILVNDRQVDGAATDGMLNFAISMYDQTPSSGFV